MTAEQPQCSQIWDKWGCGSSLSAVNMIQMEKRNFHTRPPRLLSRLLEWSLHRQAAPFAQPSSLTCSWCCVRCPNRGQRTSEHTSGRCHGVGSELLLHSPPAKQKVKLGTALGLCHTSQLFTCSIHFPFICTDTVCSPPSSPDMKRLLPNSLKETFHISRVWACPLFPNICFSPHVVTSFITQNSFR